MLVQGKSPSNLGQLDQAPCFDPETSQTSEAETHGTVVQN
jgi:NRPS condensation-like uncharacterized protein